MWKIYNFMQMCHLKMSFSLQMQVCHPKMYTSLNAGVSFKNVYVILNAGVSSQHVYFTLNAGVSPQNVYFILNAGVSPQNVYFTLNAGVSSQNVYFMLNAGVLSQNSNIKYKSSCCIYIISTPSAELYRSNCPCSLFFLSHLKVLCLQVVYSKLIIKHWAAKQFCFWHNQPVLQTVNFFQPSLPSFCPSW